MGRNRESKLWWGSVRRKLFRSAAHRKGSNSSIIVLHTNDGRFSEDLTCSSAAYDHETVASEFMLTAREDFAAVMIQACFRGHLARRAFRALKSLVKLQALVRGVVVRRQARIALCCMNALARLQITVRARQLLEAHC